MFSRALLIRGGALGDFILTLPVAARLRALAPGARVEIMAGPAFTPLAVQPDGAHAARSIEYGPMARFFARGTELDPSLATYFASFDLVVGYLYDPDGIFAGNLSRAGVRRYLPGCHKPTGPGPATRQLAAVLRALGPQPTDLPPPRLTPTPDDLTAAGRLFHGNQPFVVLHPGSGSPAKNWPPGHWARLIGQALDETSLDVVLVFGEADEAVRATLAPLLSRPRLATVNHPPLRELAALLARARAFAGHDSGVSHLAAAAGTPALLLYGPTDPKVWAPQHPHVRVLTAPGGDLTALVPGEVWSALRRLLPAAIPA